jgi:hypothetical protein
LIDIPVVKQQLSYVIVDRLYRNPTDRCALACTSCPQTRGFRRVNDYDLSLNHWRQAESKVG